MEALQNLIDPYYEAIRASSINMQKGEHERVKQKVTDAEAAGLDPLATGAYASGLEEGTLRHVVREALKRKLLKEWNFLDAPLPIELPDETEESYDLSQETGQAVDLSTSVSEPSENPFDADYEPYREQKRAIIDKWTAPDSDLWNHLSSGPDGETLFDDKPLPAWFSDWQKRYLVKDSSTPFGKLPDDEDDKSHSREGMTDWLKPNTGYGYRGPFKLNGKWVGNKHHYGFDMGATEGTPLRPIVNSEFYDAGYSDAGGNWIKMKTKDPNSGEDIYIAYMHLRDPVMQHGDPAGEALFPRGQPFEAGKDIPAAFVGSTGKSTSPHLHIQIRRGTSDGEIIDPAEYFCSAGATSWCKHRMGGPEGRHANRKDAIEKDASGDLQRRLNKLRQQNKPRSPTANSEEYTYDPDSGAYRTSFQESLKKESAAPDSIKVSSSARLYQVVLVLKVSQPIRDIKGKLNRIRAIEGVTIVSHEREEETVYRGDVVAKVKFHPMNDMMTPATFINQHLVPQINSSKIVPEVKVLQVVKGTIKEI